MGAAGDGEADAGARRQYQWPDQQQLQSRRQAVGLQGQPGKHAAKAQVVGLGKCVEAAVDIGKAQKANGARKEEDGAEDQKFWVSQARNAFMAFALYLFEKYDDDQKIGFPFSKPPSLGAIYRLSSGDGQSELKPFLKDLAPLPGRGFVAGVRLFF